jgi:hypothetical protein
MMDARATPAIQYMKRLSPFMRGNIPFIVESYSSVLLLPFLLVPYPYWSGKQAEKERIREP